MRRLTVFVLLACTSLFAADSPWQYGRIGDVRKSVTTKTKVWVANTPINEDETTYNVTVHLVDKLLVGTYDLMPELSPPPVEWVAGYPVKVQIEGNSMYVRSPTGGVRLRILQRKNAHPMQPLTADEKKGLEQIETPSESLIGFSDSSSRPNEKAKPVVEEPPPPPPPPTNIGTINVRSTPYLSEVFVDGDSMGYTPAKINLAPGKHTFRVEKPGFKPWTKEMMVTVGSELTLDANLEKK